MNGIEKTDYKTFYEVPVPLELLPREPGQPNRIFTRSDFLNNNADYLGDLQAGPTLDEDIARGFFS